MGNLNEFCMGYYWAQDLMGQLNDFDWDVTVSCFWVGNFRVGDCCKSIWHFNIGLMDLDL